MVLVPTQNDPYLIAVQGDQGLWWSNMRLAQKMLTTSYNEMWGRGVVHMPTEVPFNQVSAWS